MKLLNFNVIKFTCSLILGILMADAISISNSALLILSSICVAILLLAHLIYIKTFNHGGLFGSITLLLVIGLGTLTTKFHQQKRWPHHFENVININSDSLYDCTFKVIRILKPTRFHDKYVVAIFSINSSDVKGKLLLNLTKDSLAHPLHIDAIYKAKLSLIDIQKPLNPHQFNYREYLKRQYIYRQSNAIYNELFKIQNKPHSLRGYAALIRQTVRHKLISNGFKGTTLSIIESLFLGQRQSIKTEIYNDYINAGVVHILAISGLHVGIILMILNYILSPITFIKYGKNIKLIIILLLLWSFAIISGLSASVVRAVTMFSIVAFSMHIKRKTNIYNTLTFSIFILLLIKPHFLFDVGFQLSYTAVFAIVWIKPLFDKLWRPRYKLLKTPWDIFTVSLAAQIGVTPISLFYFHQFPGLFFISNLVIIPFIGIILSLGLMIIALVLCDLLPDILGRFFAIIIETLNAFVAWVADKEQYLITDIAFDFKLLLPIYLMLITCILFLKKRSVNYFYTVMITTLILQSVLIVKKHYNPKDRFIIFHKSRYTLIGKQYQKSLKVAHNLDSSTLYKNTSIKDYKIANYLKDISYTSLKDFYFFNNKLLLIVDSLGVYNVRLKQPDYILLRNSPKVNLNRLIDSLQPQGIIADGSNYTSYVHRWRITCNKRKLPFHYTRDMGAFILKK